MKKLATIFLMLVLGIALTSARAGEIQNFSIEDLSAINLKQKDVPKNYQLREDKGGLTQDPVHYAEGDKKDAKRLKKLGWEAVDEVYYRTVDKNGVERNNVYSALSVYKDNRKMEQGLKDIEANFLKDKGIPVKTSKTFGEKSILYLTEMEEPKAGKIILYELRFYQGNAFANLEIGGSPGAVSQKEIEKYGALIEKRLKEGL